MPLLASCTHCADCIVVALHGTRHRFLESIPKAETAVALLVEADAKYQKKLTGQVQEQAMILDRCKTKLAAVREENVSMGRPADAATDKETAAQDAITAAVAVQKRIEDMDPPTQMEVQKFVVAVDRAKTAVNDAHDAIKDRVALIEMRSRQKNAQALDRAKAVVKKMQKDIVELRQLLTTLIAHPTHNLSAPLALGEDEASVTSPSAASSADAARLQAQAAQQAESIQRTSGLVKESEDSLRRCDDALATLTASDTGVCVWMRASARCTLKSGHCLWLLVLPLLLCVCRYQGALRCRQFLHCHRHRCNRTL